VWRVPDTDLVVVSSFDAVTEVVSRVDDFSSHLHALIYRSELGTPALLPFDSGELQTLAIADPPVHAKHRSTVLPELVARRMAAIRADVEALAKEHLAAALARGRFDAMHDLANAIPIRVVSRLIGFQAADPVRLLAAAFASTEMLAATQPLDGVQAAMGRSAEVVAWIGDQLQRAVDEAADGILGVIGAAVAAGDFEFAEGLVIMHTLLSAGGESTTSLLGSAIHMLAMDPALQARLRDEPRLVAPFIEEVLRLESPFRYHMRHATRATDVRGVPIAAGSTVLLLLGSRQPGPGRVRPPRRRRARSPRPQAPPRVRAGNTLLRRGAVGSSRGGGRAPPAPGANRALRARSRSRARPVEQPRRAPLQRVASGRAAEV
jgi:cytochrome P450